MTFDLKALRAKQAAKLNPTTPAKPPAAESTEPVKKPTGLKLKLNTGPRKKIEPPKASEVIPSPETPSQAVAVETPTDEAEAITSPLAGESPAAAAVLEVDQSLMSQQERFINNIERLDHVIHDKEILGSVLEDVMTELSSNPEYKKFMSDAHLHTMMRSLSETFAVVKASKTAKSKAKPAKGRKKKAKPLSASAQLMLDSMELKDGKIDIGSLGNIVI